MYALGLTPASRLAGVASLVLRLGLGIVFVAHGWQKMMAGPQNFGSSMLAGLGVPAPEFVGWLVAIGELGGGILLLVGLVTRLATLPPIGIMIGAILLVKLQVGLIAPPGAGAGRGRRGRAGNRAAQWAARDPDPRPRAGVARPASRRRAREGPGRSVARQRLMSASFAGDAVATTVATPWRRRTPPRARP